MSANKFAGIEVARLQRYGAAALFLVCTLPTVLAFVYAATGMREGALHWLMYRLASPGFPTLYAAYIVTTFSTLMGAVLLPSLKTTDGDKQKILPAGLGVLGYSVAIAVLGFLFQVVVGDAETLGYLKGQLPADGAYRLINYVSWSIGAALTVAATLIGVPAPKPAPGARPT